MEVETVMNKKESYDIKSSLFKSLKLDLDCLNLVRNPLSHVNEPVNLDSVRSEKYLNFLEQKPDLVQLINKMGFLEIKI